MASVYQNAFLTIAASASSSMDGGCYSSSPDCRYEIKISDPEVTATSIYARRELCHIGHGSHNLPIPQLPLLQRGWVYQERLLSSRVIYFSHGEIGWECMEGTTCECGRYKRYGVEVFDKWSTKAYHKRGSSGFRAVEERWRQMVEEYSCLALTRESDKMAAIYGLVDQMRPLRKGPYIAGLWADQFHMDLTWHCKRPGRRPSKWRAPTWSWVSIDGLVDYKDISSPKFKITTSTNFSRGRALQASFYLLKVIYHLRATWWRDI
jgi:hypothetical protein